MYRLDCFGIFPLSSVIKLRGKHVIYLDRSIDNLCNYERFQITDDSIVANKILAIVCFHGCSFGCEITKPSCRFSRPIVFALFVSSPFSTRRDDYWPTPDKAFPLIFLSRFSLISAPFWRRATSSEPRTPMEKSPNFSNSVLPTFNHRETYRSSLSPPRLNLTDEIAFARRPMFLNESKDEFFSSHPVDY